MGLFKKFLANCGCRGTDATPDTYGVNKYHLRDGTSATSATRAAIVQEVEPIKEKVVEEPVKRMSAGPVAMAAGAAALAGGAALTYNNPSDDHESTASESSASEASEEKKIELPSIPKSKVTMAAAAAGLSVAAQQKLGDVNQSGVERMEAINARAVEDIGSIYSENGMTVPEPKYIDTDCGNLDANLGFTGASAAARKAGMGSLDLGRVQAIEKNAKEQITSIDKEAGDDIEEIYESEGKWYQKPGASKAAAAAATAGLSLAAIKHIAGKEKAADQEIDDIDNEAARAVIEADKLHAEQMYKYPKGMTDSFIEDEEETALAKYADIESDAKARIKKVDGETGDLIAETYNREGKVMAKSWDGAKTLMGGPATARGAAGATATAAAIAAATKGSQDRKKLLSNLRKDKEFSTDRALEEETKDDNDFSIGNGIHLAVYDFGHGVAKVGGTITRGDWEGPEEYDERAGWSPEKRARCCPAY